MCSVHAQDRLRDMQYIKTLNRFYFVFYSKEQLNQLRPFKLIHCAKIMHHNYVPFLSRLILIRQLSYIFMRLQKSLAQA